MAGTFALQTRGLFPRNDSIPMWELGQNLTKGLYFGAPHFGDDQLNDSSVLIQADALDEVVKASAFEKNTKSLILDAIQELRDAVRGPAPPLPPPPTLTTSEEERFKEELNDCQRTAVRLQDQVTELEDSVKSKDLQIEKEKANCQEVVNREESSRQLIAVKDAEIGRLMTEKTNLENQVNLLQNEGKTQEEKREALRLLKESQLREEDQAKKNTEDQKILQLKSTVDGMVKTASESAKGTKTTNQDVEDPAQKKRNYADTVVDLGIKKREISELEIEGVPGSEDILKGGMAKIDELINEMENLSAKVVSEPEAAVSDEASQMDLNFALTDILSTNGMLAWKNLEDGPPDFWTEDFKTTLSQWPLTDILDGIGKAGAYNTFKSATTKINTFIQQRTTWTATDYRIINDFTLLGTPDIAFATLNKDFGIMARTFFEMTSEQWKMYNAGPTGTGNTKRNAELIRRTRDLLEINVAIERMYQGVDPVEGASIIVTVLVYDPIPAMWVRSIKDISANVAPISISLTTIPEK